MWIHSNNIVIPLSQLYTVTSLYRFRQDVYGKAWYLCNITRMKQLVLKWSRLKNIPKSQRSILPSFFRLPPSGVTTADRLLLSHSLPGILFFHTSPLHVLHRIHGPSLWSSSFPPASQLHIQHVRHPSSAHSKPHQPWLSNFVSKPLKGKYVSLTVRWANPLTFNFAARTRNALQMIRPLSDLTASHTLWV